MKKIIITLALILSISSQAEVSTQSGYSSLKVETYQQNGEDFVKFNYCQAGVKCRHLGPKEVYNRRDLEDKRFDERLEIAYSTAADVGVGAAAIWASLSAAVAYGASVAFTIPAGASAGVITPIISGSMIDRLNPLEQYRQASTLSNDVLDNEEVILDTEDELFDFISRLELVLSK